MVPVPVCIRQTAMNCLNRSSWYGTYRETERFRQYILRESALQNMQEWQVMEMYKKDIRPRDIMTKEAIL